MATSVVWIRRWSNVLVLASSARFLFLLWHAPLNNACRPDAAERSVDPFLWRLEVERVAPRLKKAVRALGVSVCVCVHLSELRFQGKAYTHTMEIVQTYGALIGSIFRRKLQA